MIKILDWLKVKWYIIFIIAIAGFALILSNAPYFYGWMSSPEGLVYIPSRFNNYSDTSTYLAWLEQARQGKILFEVLYTTEPQNAGLFHPVFHILGLIANILDISNYLVYQMARVVVGIVLFVIAYWFICKFFTRISHRTLAFAVFCLGSGLGWLFGPYSVDMIQSESTNFLSVYESLLYPITLSLMMVAIIIFLYSRKDEVVLKGLKTGIIGNLVALVHTHDFIILSGVLGLYTTFFYFKEKQKDYIRVYLYYVLFSFPAVLWQAYVLNKNSILGMWATQLTNFPSTDWLSYVTVYFLLILFCILAWIVIYRRGWTRLYIFILWILFVIIALYNPITSRFQQKLSLGIFIAFSMLSSVAIVWLIDNINYRIFKYGFVVMTLLVLMQTNIYIIYKDIQTISLRPRELYTEQDTVKTLEWIKKKTDPSSIVLAGPITSNLIPALTGRFVFYGHYDQTVNYWSKKNQAALVFTRLTDNQSNLYKWLTMNKIDYILYNSEVSQQTQLPDSDFLTIVYSQGNNYLYKVK